MKTLALLCALASLTGCATAMGDVRTFQQDPSVPTSQQIHAQMAAQTAMRAQAQQPAMQPVAMVTTTGDGGGSIYSNAGATGTKTMRLFQDNKARDVGDLLTIILVETTTASTKTSTAINKQSSIDLAAPTIAGQSVTYKGKNILQVGVDGKRGFNGAGDTKQSNSLDGTVSVTVVQDLGNGNLLVSGEKKLRLNQGDEVVQFQGVVRTSDISADNTISSERVADAKIVYGGRGPVSRSNAMGWLDRFFNSALMPY
ncbi:flagellar basal body L-ring protein FlgH [Cognatilysobacter terrigena]|uniref:flagellar basal body L-ring protein FlgH n=1 Tax=Cognatilysobacter terrigena TaxID=2488749 RepID=UPI001FE3E2EE|nr:flagellar basal body L-ring protein FlgH [Lysobacter terrigena]